LDQLEHNTFEGEVFIIDNSFRYDPQTKTRDRVTNYISNYPRGSDEHNALRDKVLAELGSTKNANGRNLIQYLKEERTTDRYHAVIKLPNGKIIFAPLKSKALPVEEHEKLLTKLKERAAKTREENINPQGKKIKKDFNDEFNAEFNDEFYISLKEGYNAELRVTADGGVEIRYHDIKNDTYLNVDGYLNEAALSTITLEKMFDVFNEMNKISKSTKDLNIKLSIDNLKVSFGTEILANELTANTVTNVSTQLFTDLSVRFNFNNGQVDNYIATKVAEDTIANNATAEPVGTQAAQNAVNALTQNLNDEGSVDLMSEEEFEIHSNEDFLNLDKEYLENIASKIALSGEQSLSEREAAVFKSERKALIEYKVNDLKVNSPVDSDYVQALNALNEKKAERDARLTELQEMKDSGAITAQEFVQATAMKKDVLYKKLSAEISLLERKVNSYAPKLMGDDFTMQDVESIDEFIKWAQNNLPDFVQIRNIKEVADRLKVNGIPIGLFAMHLNKLAGGVEVAGTVYVGDKGFRYHEAFHAVFRLLLSDAEIKQYTDIARSEVRSKFKNDKDYKLELEKFRSRAEKYSRMSDAKLEQEYLEEYMADEFEKFKQNPLSSKTSSAIKSFFTRLVEWIKNVFSKYNKNDLKRLFENIDAGKYKSTSPINNMYTQEFKTGVVLDAYKILTYDKIELDRGFANKYVDPDTANLLIRQITSSYLLRVKKITIGQTRESILMQTLEDFRSLYNPLANFNSNKTGEQLTKMHKLYIALGGVVDANNVNELSQAIEFEDNAISVVTQYISLFDQQIQNEQYFTEEYEESEGLRNVSDWDKDQSMIGGFSNLPTALRAYIGTTMLMAQDEFGNSKLPSGEPIYTPVDFKSAYNGLLKSVKNITDPINFLRAMNSFSKGNNQTKAVVDRIFSDLGISEELVVYGEYNDVLSSITNKTMFMEIYNGFENFKVDYLFIHANTATENGKMFKKILMYNAANRDDAANQVDVWKQSYGAKYNAIKNDQVALNKATDSLDKLVKVLKETTKSIDSIKLAEIAKELSDNIAETTGIRLSPSYIEFSIISNLSKLDGSGYQQEILNNNKQAEAIEIDSLIEIVNQIKISSSSMTGSGYLFNKKGSGVRSRLNKLAKSNAMFDETIGQSVFLNPEGNFVYAHQMPTFHLKEIEDLNSNASKLEEHRQKDNGYNVTNILLNSPAFLALSQQDRLSVLRVAGTKEGALPSTNESALSDENNGVLSDKEGKTYGTLTGPEFTAGLLNTYLANYQQLSQKNKTVEFIDPETGFPVETALAPVLIRVIEASNTGDMLSLPIIKTVELDSKGAVRITDETIDLFYEEINREFQRIQRESAIPVEDRTLIEGYNAKNGAPTNTGRAFQFFGTQTLLESGAYKENKVEVKDPKFEGETAKRVLEGTQSTVYVSEIAAKTIGLVVKGRSANVIVRAEKEEEAFSLISLGQIKVTPDTIEEIVDSMGDAISDTKTKEFPFKVVVGDVELYVENKATQQFLYGKTTRFGYKLTEPNSTQETSDTKADEIVVENLKEKLETIAKENPKLTLEEALANEEINLSLSAFKESLRQRLIQEYSKFRSDLDSLNVIQDISVDLLNGFTNDQGISQGDSAMEQLNLIRNNQEYNLMQVFFNDWLNTKAINQILLGDQSVSLKDSVDQIKRAKMQNASYISAFAPIYDKELGVNHVTKDILLTAFTDPQFTKKYTKDAKGDRADAQMYITTKALRHMLFGFGKLNKVQADLINRLEKGEAIEWQDFWGYKNENGNKVEGFKDLGAIFNSMKLVYGDGKTFLKMSAVVLTKELTSRNVGTIEEPIWEPKVQYKELHNLRLKLEKQEADNVNAIGIAAPASAIKMMKQNIANHLDVFNDNVNTVITPTLLDANYMGLQMENPSNKKEITDPSQLKSLITSELDDNTDVLIGNQPFKLKDIRRKYNEANANRLNNKYFNKVNLIANFSIEDAMRELKVSKKLGELSLELDDFLKFATESLKASGAASNIIEFFNADQKYDLNNQMVIKQFEQLFLSYFAKETLTEKIPGDALALMSDQGVKVVRRVFSVDKNGNPEKFEVIRDRVYNSMVNPPAIQFEVNEDGNFNNLAEAVANSNGKGVVVLDELRHNIKEFNKEGVYTGVRYTEALRPANNEELSQIEESNGILDDIFSKSFVVRIPSQDKHSASSVKFIDFLPVYYGSTAIFSKELIEISGADFDIDKVYTQIKEYYKNSNGTIIEYGTEDRVGKEEGFSDYINYVNKKIKSRKSEYSRAYDKYLRTGLSNNKSFTKEELNKAKEEGLNKDSFIALKVLGLPTTFNEYKKHSKSKGEPYAAALNNQILNYKFAMWGNESNTIKSKEGQNPIAYDPADIAPLTEVFEDIKRELPELAELVAEGNLDVDNLLGKSKAFTNNKEGAASIGAIVLPNLFLNLLGEQNISILSKKVSGKDVIPQIELNNLTFSNFNTENERVVIYDEKLKKYTEVSGKRTQYIISALITAMTDNAKERLAAKLGLNKDALAVVGMLTKLGVPIKTSILLVNHPVIKQEYFYANNKRFKNDPSISSRISNLIKSIEINHEGIKNKQYSVTDDLLKDAIKNQISYDPEMNIEDIAQIYSALKQFENAHRIKDFIGELSSVMGMTRGFGKDFVKINETEQALEQLGINMTNDEFSKAKFKGYPLPVDVRGMLKSNIWQANMVNVFNHFKDIMLPQVFLTRTPMFMKMQENVLRNMSSSKFIMDETVKDKASKDLLSFLTIRAYTKFLERKGSDMSLASLSNEMLYPQSASELNISNLIKSLRKQYPDNFFLNEFSFIESATDLDNTAGIHRLESNTFGKKDDIDKLRVQAAFMELYGESKLDAMHIVHYMMVKDGFQYGMGSLLEAVTPAVLDGFTISTEDIFELMKNNRTGEAFTNKFGSTYDELLNEFIFGYLQSNKNNIYLNTLRNIPFYSEVFENLVVSTTNVTKKIALTNPDKVYIFSENETNRGTVGTSEIRGLENARPITLMYDLDTLYDDTDLNSFVDRLDAEVADIIESNKEYVFPKDLLNSKTKSKLKKQSPKIYNYLEAKLRQTFGYSIESGVLTEVGSSSLKAVAASPVQMKLKNEEGSLTIDVYNGIAKMPSGEQTKNLRIIKDVPGNKIVKLQSNLKTLDKLNINVRRDILVKGKITNLAEFPAIIKTVTGTKGNKVGRIFKLNKVYGPLVSEGETLINSQEGVAYGNAAEYVLVKTKGSNFQNAIGFMFDTVSFERPSYSEIKDYVANDERVLISEDGFEDENGETSNYLLNKQKAEDAGLEIEYDGSDTYVYADRGRILLSELKDSDVNVTIEESEIEQDLENNYDDEPIEANVEEDAGQSASTAAMFAMFNVGTKDLKEEHPSIVKWWDNNIQNNPEKLSNLAASEGIVTLEQLLEERTDPDQSYASDEEFIDKMESCTIK